MRFTRRPLECPMGPTQQSVREGPLGQIHPIPNSRANFSKRRLDFRSTDESKIGPRPESGLTMKANTFP
jgi:hypothetical protein